MFLEFWHDKPTCKRGWNTEEKYKKCIQATIILILYKLVLTIAQPLKLYIYTVKKKERSTDGCRESHHLSAFVCQWWIYHFRTFKVGVILGSGL